MRSFRSEQPSGVGIDVKCHAVRKESSHHTRAGLADTLRFRGDRYSDRRQPSACRP